MQPIDQSKPEPGQARFDKLLKALLLARTKEVLTFMVAEVGYELVSYEWMPNELQAGQMYRLDALIKAAVKGPDGKNFVVYTNMEFQHTNDPKMVERLYDYRKAVVTNYQNEMVLPIVVYTGEYPCKMELVIDDYPLNIFKINIPLVNISQMKAEKLSQHPSEGVRLLSILNHHIAPNVLAQILFDSLKNIRAAQGIFEMNRWYNMFIRCTTPKNAKAMKKLAEMMQVYPELAVDDPGDLYTYFRLMNELEVEDAIAAEREKAEIERNKAIAAEREKAEIERNKAIAAEREKAEIERNKAIAAEREKAAAEREKEEIERRSIEIELKALATRIESAYLLMNKTGMTFEEASTTLSLNETEQEMLRHRISQNGH